MSRETIAIILPNRIGDAILCLPAILCLKQLKELYGSDNFEITIFAQDSLVEIIELVNLFNTKKINYTSKIKSWIKPADRVFFLDNTSKNAGFFAKISHGLMASNKKFIKYAHNMPYLNFNADEKLLPEQLVVFLRNTYQLPSCAIRNFGLCLDFGYSVDQIQTAFKFDLSSLTLKNLSLNLENPIKSKYIVFCMEAAYNKKRDFDRRWPKNHYLELAEKIYLDYGLYSVFIGINNFPKIPDKPYFKDMRKKLSLKQTAQVIKLSEGYIGNDTGPLHLANLVKKKSIGLYFREDSLRVSTPVFDQLNTAIFNPQKPEDLYDYLDSFI